MLLVGAGGIGSEVLKTLVLTGFRHITVIDLDTIETSNLNRQFLFRSWHVGSSKAVVAASAVENFLPVINEDITMPARKKQRDDFFCSGSSGSASARRRRVDRDSSLDINPFRANIRDQQFDVDFFKRLL